MDVNRLLAELIQERTLIDQAISSLQRLSLRAGRAAPRSQPERSRHQDRPEAKAKSAGAAPGE